jgi:hypothetical protein
VGSTDEVVGEQQDIYAVLEEVAAGMEDGRRGPAMRKLLVAVSDTRGQKREGDGGFGPRPDRGGRFNGVAHVCRARPQLGARWATPPDKRARYRPQSH